MSAKTIGLLAAFTVLRLCQAAADSRPNILFCIADDWAWPHAGVYGDAVVKTPNVDALAREGVLFRHAFSAAPSCTPSRAAILTGQAPHRLEAGANLWGTLEKKFPAYPELLERAGYTVGFTRKGWGPGNFQAGGRERNPAGPPSRDLKTFLASAPADKPFCFWFGSQDPHRAYEPGSGAKAGLDATKAFVPPFWPDNATVRNDILDYYAEVQRFDRDLGSLLDELRNRGRLTNTIVVVTGDNGWPFPRAKANLYDAGTRQPLIVWWPGAIKAGQVIDDFVSLTDLAPTFLEVAGLKPLREMTGRSFLKLLTGKEKPGRRNEIFVERERHANVRQGDLGYPCRAIRTRDYLFILNFQPDRWPAGDPEKWKAVGPYGDVDDGPTKQFILDHRDEPSIQPLYRLAFYKRPAEELYDLRKDPHQMTNVASKPEYARTRKQLRARLESWMKSTHDPRAGKGPVIWDQTAYFGPN